MRVRPRRERRQLRSLAGVCRLSGAASDAKRDGLSRTLVSSLCEAEYV
jgi:hypothetical protein